MKVNSNFKLNINTDLSMADFKVLTFLYQPIIGVSAYALYQTFYHLAKFNQPYKHQMLNDLLNIKQADFIENRERLEAVGLLESYKQDDSNYVYIIKPPYSAKRFLVDTFLGTYLESEIGTDNLKNIIEMFTLEGNDLSNHQNITKYFDDIYEVKVKKLLQVDRELEGKNGYNNTDLIRNSMNYAEFVDSLPRALKNPSLFNENYKQKLMQLAFVYGYTVSDMVLIYTEASKGKKDVKVEHVNLQAKIYFESTNDSLTIREKTTDDESLINKQTFRTIVNKFGSKDPIIKANALSTINEFITTNEVDKGVLNVLLIFILKNKDGILPHVNYLNKVWESWQKNGVRTTGDALKHRDYIENKWNETKNNRSSKENNPAWLEEYMKELEALEG